MQHFWRHLLEIAVLIVASGVGGAYLSTWLRKRKGVTQDSIVASAQGAAKAGAEAVAAKAADIASKL